jgi:prepilin-type processing-associated H-X9-DG protein
LRIFAQDYPPDWIPIFYNKEPFHNRADASKGINYLYGDGHIRKLLELEGTKRSGSWTCKKIRRADGGRTTGFARAAR